MARNTSKSNKRSEASTQGAARRSNSAGASSSSARRSSHNARGNRQSNLRRSTVSQTALQAMSSRALSVFSEHPIPLAVMGAGLAMLLAENRTVLGSVEKRMMRRGGEMLGNLGESVSEYTSSAREALGPVRQSVSNQTSRIGEYLSNGASSVGQGVESAYEYGRDAIADTWERHPVMLCAGILAAGLAAGMLLPATRRENSLLGRTSDAVARKVRQQGRKIFDEGRVLAADAADTITETVNSLGFGEQSSSRNASTSKGRNNRRSR